MSARVKSGFTLLEMVLVLVLVSVAAAMLLPFMRAGLDHSFEAPLRLVQSGALAGEMAEIVARNTNDLETLRVALVAEGVDAEYVAFTETPPFQVVTGGGDLLRVVLTDEHNHRLVTLLSEP